ncbi:MAG TPA: GGDEF domain-containing protein [Stellaceae bacterium]|nr:GGDEF domain-containing protein [Stellaceae bacterium]
MIGPADNQLSLELADKAIKAMLGHEVSPTPQNYAVWYTYAAGTQPELTRTLDILISNKQNFTPDLNAELYARFFDATGQLGILSDAGGRLTHIVDQVRKLVETSSGDATAFGRTLDDFSEAIGETGEATDIRALVADLVVETQRVAERNRTLEEKLTKASGEVSELKQHLETVQREALTDALTGIPNRKSFETRLREAARDAMENDEQLCLLIADIDHFKRFNDTYGHHIGDQVLRLVAKTLTDSVRGRDTSARFGGEEFAIILPQTALADATVVAEHIRQGLTRRKLVGRDKNQDYGGITLSFGAAEYRPGEPLSTFVERADAALYRAKREGRNRVAIEADEKEAAKV